MPLNQPHNLNYFFPKTIDEEFVKSYILSPNKLEYFRRRLQRICDLLDGLNFTNQVMIDKFTDN